MSQGTAEGERQAMTQPALSCVLEGSSRGSPGGRAPATHSAAWGGPARWLPPPGRPAPSGLAGEGASRWVASVAGVAGGPFPCFEPLRAFAVSPSLLRPVYLFKQQTSRWLWDRASEQGPARVGPEGDETLRLPRGHPRRRREEMTGERSSAQALRNACVWYQQRRPPPPPSLPPSLRFLCGL